MKILLIILLSMLSPVGAQIRVEYFNDRFMKIHVPAKFVKARLSHKNEDGNSIYWVEVVTKKETFDFLARRALPYERCLQITLEVRKLLKSSKNVILFGSVAKGKEKVGEYHSSFEAIHGDDGLCVDYFPNYCNEFVSEAIGAEEMKDWNKEPINSKLYP